LAAMLAVEFVHRRPGRVLFLAHRDELLSGAKDDFDFVGVPTVLEKAQSRALRDIDRARRDFWDPVDIRTVIGSVQTMKGKRLDEWPEDYFDLIITDESHHSVVNVGTKKKPRTAVQKQYGAIYNRFPKAKLVGLTGSPNRADLAEMGFLYESLGYEYLLREAVLEGDLCKIKQVRSRVQIDLTKVRKEASGMKQGDVEDAVVNVLHPLCNAIRENLWGRKILVFCPGREDATDEVRPCQLFAAGLKKMGFRSAAVWADHPKRHQIAAEFRAGEYDCVCCADLYNEGVNFPFVDGISLCSITESPVVLGQRIGRGTRKYLRPDGTWKEDCLILTFDWQFDDNVYHVMEPYELFRPEGADKALDAIVRRLQITRPDADMIEILDEAERQAKADELEKQTKAAREDAKRKLAEKPVEVHLEIGDSGIGFDLIDPFASFERKRLKKPICDPAWVEVLVGFGVPRQDAMHLTNEQAQAQQEYLFERYARKLANPTQVKKLIGFGVSRSKAEKMTVQEASDYIYRRAGQVNYFSRRRA
jgi:superfamily II DNA or RNA helicase